MSNILKKSSFFLVIAVAIGVFLFFTRDDTDKSSTELNAVLGTEAETTAQEAAEEVITDLDTTAIVDVKGQVKMPGVYEVEIASRVNDVIDTAGGFTKEADKTQVNLAQKVQDEMVIMIPKEGETVVQLVGEGMDGSDKVKINQASQEEIETLSGIGPSKALTIIKYREEHGLFKTEEDLLEISGIGEKTLENIKDDIQVP